jgi:riboflavin kinase
MLLNSILQALILNKIKYMIYFFRGAHDVRWSHLYSPETVLARPYTLSSEVIRGFQRGSTELGFPTANLNPATLTIAMIDQEGSPHDHSLSNGGHKMATDNLSTGNLSIDDLQIGVYVGCARIWSSSSSSASSTPSATDETSESESESESVYYPCVYSVGWNPSYNNSSKSIEAHFLDIDLTSSLLHETPVPSDFYGASVDIHTLVYLRDEHKFDNIGALLLLLN